jgi:hypothetical protein
MAKLTMVKLLTMNKMDLAKINMSEIIMAIYIKHYGNTNHGKINNSFKLIMGLLIMFKFIMTK